MKRTAADLRTTAKHQLNCAAVSLEYAIAHVERGDAVIAGMCSKAAIAGINEALKRLKMSREKGRL